MIHGTAQLMADTQRGTGDVPIKVRKGSNLQEIGRSGLLTFGGQVREEFLPQLQGWRARKVYREMADNDPVVGALLFAVELMVRQVEWTLEPAEDSNADAQRYAEFVDQCLHDMSLAWSATISAILSMLVYGWSYHEIVYKYRQGLDTDDSTKRSKYTDGLLGWRKFAVRTQESLVRWDLDDDGGIQGMVQSATGIGNHVTIPIQKALLFRTTAAKGNPEGRSVLRNAYRPWYMKKHIEEIEAIGIERDLAGLPVGWLPPSYLSDEASEEEKAITELVKTIIRDIKRDDQESVVWPLSYDEFGNKQFDLTLLSTGGRRQFDTDATIARYDQRIAMVVLADFILLGHEKVGSYALGASKMDLWSIALGAWLDEIAVVFNEYAIPRLLGLNGFNVNLSPQLVHGEVKEIDVSKIAQAVLQLTQAGMSIFPDPETENRLRTLLDLPLLDQSKDAL